jgi:hypothetical protein
MTNLGSSLSSWPERCAIALLAIPVALFFSTWYHPLIGLPTGLIALWIGWRAAMSIEPSALPSRKNLLQIALIAFLLTWTAGLGGFFHQEWDHNFRNALLRDLIVNPWPVLWEGPKGTIVLDYYLAWSMLPALVGKLLGWQAATLSMAAIAFLGAFLVILIFVRVVGTWRWWIPLVFVFWSGMDSLGWLLRFIGKGDFPGLTSFVDAWSYPLWYLSHVVNFYCVSHLVIPSWLVTLLIVGRKVPPKRLVGLSAFLVPLAPFAAVGLVPFVIWAVLDEKESLVQSFRKSLTPENIIPPLAFIALCAPYFLGNQGLEQRSGWFWQNAAPPLWTTWVKYGAFWCFEIILPAAAIWFSGLKERILLLVLLVLCLVPLRSTGISNDWALKVSVPGLFILSLLTARALVRTAPRRAPWYLIAVFALGVFSPLQEFTRSAVDTFTGVTPWQADYLKTFNPNVEPSPWEAPYVINFHSRPLSELPLLERMLR